MHVIYLEWPLARNAGGPAGYLWHLRQGLSRMRPSPPIKFIAPSNSPPPGWGKGGLLKRAIDSLTQTKHLWRFLKSYGPTTLRRSYRDLVGTAIEQLFFASDVEQTLSDEDVSSLHCHTTMDAVRADNSLRRMGRRDQVKLYLTSHCPEMPAIELTEILVAAGLRPQLAHNAFDQLLKIDLHAFRAADVIVFPCQESMEPYFETCDLFGNAIAGKKLCHVLTGIEDVPPTQDIIPGEFHELFKIAYVGRHNSVKGYDLLLEALPPFLDRTGAVLFVAGRQGPFFAPCHTRWRELGWIPTPSALIKGCDIFLLPNRRTYFDLVAIEAMAMGRAILASSTGGNKALAALTPGVTLFSPNEECLSAALEHIASCGREELHRRGQANRAVYESTLTADAFADRYVRMLES